MNEMPRQRRTGPRRREEEGKRAHSFRGGINTHAYLLVGRRRRRRRRRPVVVSRRNGNAKRKGKFISFHFISFSRPWGRIKSNRNRRSSFVCDGTSRVGTELHRRLWCERRRIRSSTASTRNGNRREKRREIINTESHRVNRHLLVGWTIDCIELDFVSS